MTSKEFHALAHDYGDSLVQEAKKYLENALKELYTNVNVYIAEAHGGYVFLCATYKELKDHAITLDKQYWMEVADGKCVALHFGWACSTYCVKLRVEE